MKTGMLQICTGGSFNNYVDTERQVGRKYTFGHVNKRLAACKTFAIVHSEQGQEVKIGYIFGPRSYRMAPAVKEERREEENMKRTLW